MYASLKPLESILEIENVVDYKIAFNDLKSKELLLKLEKSKALPTLDVFLNGSYSGNNNQFNFLDKSQNWFGASLFGVSMRVPLFSSFGRSASTIKARLNLEKSKSLLKDTSEKIKLDISRAKSEYEFAVEDLKIKKEALELSENIAKKNEIKFFEGLVTSFDLSQAQRQLYAAQEDYLSSMLNILTKRIDLEALITPTLFTLTLVLSCGTSEKESQSLTELKTKKAALKEQMNQIGSELKAVEMAISELDTLKKLMSVTSIKPEIKDFNHYIEVQGVVKADQTIDLHTEMGGTVTAILVKEGQKVSKGQLLATLDSDVIDNSVLQLDTQLALATTTFERQARLWKQNIGSEIQYLQAKAQKESLENNVKSLRAQARKMKLIAPFSGVIDQIYTKTGELSSPQKPFLKLVNLNTVYVESEVTETYLKSIKKDTKALLNFNSIGTAMEASISQVGNFINPSNRSFKMRIDLKNSNNELKANLLARRYSIL
jgi:multidrug efflux pump subunit AcrA (membrane-fusion protein)